MRYVIFFFLYMRYVSVLHSQDIEVYQAREIKSYATYSQLPIKKIFASIDSRDIIFYLAADNMIWVATWRDTSWLSWPVIEKYTTDTELNIQQYQIDNHGSEEVIVWWEYIGKIEFLDVVFKGVQIWNVDDAICYLDEITVALEQRFLHESDLHYYAGCERKIIVKGNELKITPFECDYDLGIELIDAPIHHGIFCFSGGRYRKKQTGNKE